MRSSKEIKRISIEEEEEMEKNTIYFEDYAPLDNDFTKEELSKIFDQIRQDIKNGVRRR